MRQPQPWRILWEQKPWYLSVSVPQFPVLWWRWAFRWRAPWVTKRGRLLVMYEWALGPFRLTRMEFYRHRHLGDKKRREAFLSGIEVVPRGAPRVDL